MSALRDHLAQQLSKPVSEPVAALASIIRTRHENVTAILAYGSALRELDPSSTLIDYYVLTSDPRGVSQNAVSRLFCKLIPPNVYYLEAAVHEKTCRAKYAVLPTETLQKRVGPLHANPYFWVRFAQPMQLVWTLDAKARDRVLDVVETATVTAANTARKIAGSEAPAQQWASLFAATYRTELRPEAASRATMIVDAQRTELEQRMALSETVPTASTPWALRRLQGKALSVLRLLKAAFTFQGGADYAAWKIQRHSGVEVKLTDWHRRHPVLASILLLPRLLKRGALK